MASILPQVKHIVVLMLENRSLDNLLGWTYSGRDQPDRIIDRPNSGLPGVYDGVDRGMPHYQNLDGERYPIVKGAPTQNTPIPDPHEEYEYVNVQIFGTKTPPKTEPKPGDQMVGFLKDYASKAPLPAALQILATYYSPQQVPIINRLARSYAVSDRWFSSVPTQTNPNRAFFYCGTSLGAESNTYNQKFDAPTLWNVLANHGDMNWGIYYDPRTLPYYLGKCYTQYTFPRLDKVPNARAQFCEIETFYKKAKAGSLPAFSFLEPAWVAISGGNGNDYHPPANVDPGETLVENVYRALTANTAAWNQTLFVITFDEHGGTWDHVAPPWNALNPDGRTGPTGFDFKRFGVRVPTLLVSPLVQQKTVFRSKTTTPYDHTSLTATILKWRGIDPATTGLGKRVPNAPTFENVLSATPRSDRPRLTRTRRPGLEESYPDVPLNDLQKQLLPMVVYNLIGDKASAALQKRLVTDILKRCETQRDLRQYIEDYKRTHGPPHFDFVSTAPLSIQNSTPSPLYIHWGWDKGAPPYSKAFYLNPNEPFSHDASKDVLNQYYTVKVQYWAKRVNSWNYLWGNVWKPLGHHQKLTLSQPAPKPAWSSSRLLTIRNSTPSPIYVYWGWDKGLPPFSKEFYLDPGQAFTHDASKDTLNQNYTVKVQYWVKRPRGWKYLWNGWKAIGHKQTLTVRQGPITWEVTGPPDPCA